MVRQFLSKISAPHLDDSAVGRAMRLVVGRLNELLDVSILKGELVKAQAVSTTGTRVFHRLGRVPVGYIIVRRNGLFTISDSDFTDGSFTLTSSLSGTVTLWVF